MRPKYSSRGIPRPLRTLSERFWAKMDVRGPDECWPWLGGSTKRGYGCIGEGGRANHKQLLAHRVSWELHFGPIPEGKEVLHRCDNPPCQNPRHFFLGTNHDNHLDMVAKDRHVRGERQPGAKLSDEAVEAIRSRYTASHRPAFERDATGRFVAVLPGSGVSMATLACEYGVSKGTIQKIIEGRRWKHV